MGPEAGRAVAAILEKVPGPGGADPAGVAGIVVFLLGAMAVFLQLQEALNRVWEVAPRPRPMFRALLMRRFVSFALVLATGALLLVSLTVSAGLVALADLLSARIQLPVVLITLANEVFSFQVLTVLLALIYRVLPDAKLEWQDVAIGAVVTSTLFSIGKWLIGYLLGRTVLASHLGLAGSTVVILMWVYYESYILLFGAEVTAVCSSRYRRHRVIPEPGATDAGTHPGREAA
jgi:membrane protein